MLSLKKTETKKFVLYISIICIAFMGMVFFIYKNYTITSHKLTKEDIAMEDEAHYGIGTEETNAEPKQDSDIKSVFKQEKTSLNVLIDPKFQELSEDVNQSPNFNVGKKNPFAP